MANLIKKKFIGNDQVGAEKILIESGSALRAMDGASEVELAKVASGEVFLNGTKILNSSNLIPAAVLPSYVDDVLEYADLASFPVTGETGKIYVAIDTNKQYRWSGSAYVQITSGAVDSVNGETGIVVLDASEILMLDGTTTIEAKLNSLQGEIDAEESARATLEGEFDAYVISNDAALAQEVSDRQTLEGEFDAYVVSNDAAVSAIDGRLTTAEGEIDTLQSDLTTLEGEFDAYVISNDAAVAALDGRVTTNEGDIAQLQSDVSALGSVAWYNEKFVVDAQIISDGFVTLANTPISGSIVANVDRLSIFEGASEDFTVAGAVITFVNQLVSPGNQALQVGDEIRVKYQK